MRKCGMKNHRRGYHQQTTILHQDQDHISLDHYSQFGHLPARLHWKNSWKCRNNREPQIPTEPSCWISVGIKIYNEDFITNHVDYSTWGWNLWWKAAKVCSGNSAGIADDAHRAYLSCFVASTILVASEHVLIVAVCSCDNLKAACSTFKSCFQTNMHHKVFWMPELVQRKYAYHRNLMVQKCRKMNLYIYTDGNEKMLVQEILSEILKCLTG